MYISPLEKLSPLNTMILSLSSGLSTWHYLTDGTTLLRRYISGGLCQTDKTLTATGFAGTEGVDWVNIDSFNITP